MSSYRDDTDLAAALRALRPTPRPEFAAELDARVAAGFPRRSARPLGGRLAAARAPARDARRGGCCSGGRRRRRRDRRRHRGRSRSPANDSGPDRPHGQRQRSPDARRPAPPQSPQRTRKRRAAPAHGSSTGSGEPPASESRADRIGRARRAKPPPAGRPLRLAGRRPRHRTSRPDRPRRRARRGPRRRRPGLRSGPRGQRHRPQLLDPRRRRRRGGRPLRAADPGREARATRWPPSPAIADVRLPPRVDRTTSPRRPSASAKGSQDSNARVQSLLAQLAGAETRRRARRGRSRAATPSAATRRPALARSPRLRPPRQPLPRLAADRDRRLRRGERRRRRLGRRRRLRRRRPDPRDRRRRRPSSASRSSPRSPLIVLLGLARPPRLAAPRPPPTPSPERA